MNTKINLLNYTLEDLENFFISIEEKKYRALQVFRWIHKFGITDFEKMSDLAKSLKNKLLNLAEIVAPTLVSEQITIDGVYKWVLSVGNDNKIETVLIPDKNRLTLCVSSQVGCALECKFCSTARQGFNRNLATSEIVGQLWWAYNRLREINSTGSITNVVMMGMGEPLANYENVVKAMQIMLDDNAYNLSKRKLTLSTSGMVTALNKLAQDCPVALAVSLHASNDCVRNQIIPLNKKYPLAMLLDACKNYIKYSPKNFITFEYVMLKDINDKLEYAHELIKLVQNIPCKFNLIPFNDFLNSGFTSSNMSQILRFQKVLQDGGLITTIRKTRGEKIDAACGQLVGKVIDKTSRQIKWQQIHAVN